MLTRGCATRSSVGSLPCSSRRSRAWGRWAGAGTKLARHTSEDAEGTVRDEPFKGERELVGLPLVVVSRVMPFLLITCEQIVPIIEIRVEIVDNVRTLQFKKRALIYMLHSFEILIFFPCLLDGSTSGLGGRILTQNVAGVEPQMSGA